MVACWRRWRIRRSARGRRDETHPALMRARKTIAGAAFPETSCGCGCAGPVIRAQRMSTAGIPQPGCAGAGSACGGADPLFEPWRRRDHRSSRHGTAEAHRPGLTPHGRRADPCRPAQLGRQRCGADRPHGWGAEVGDHGSDSPPNRRVPTPSADVAWRLPFSVEIIMDNVCTLSYGRCVWW